MRAIGYVSSYSIGAGLNFVDTKTAYGNLTTGAPEEYD
jgi:hypothetical protein